ncbi:MAG: hypothetical protein U9N45_00350 [Gemmatimonadota bacterium]|nr:hypothetical protein [Gemmatimonadota bacterium]
MDDWKKKDLKAEKQVAKWQRFKVAKEKQRQAVGYRIAENNPV